MSGTTTHHTRDVFIQNANQHSLAWQALGAAKQALRDAGPSAWAQRDQPVLGFTEQFAACLAELDKSCGGTLTTQHSTFLDLGAAPGGFSLHLLKAGLSGVGVTLPETHAVAHALDKRLLPPPPPRTDEECGVVEITGR